jgi:hypothetical protein
MSVVLPLSDFPTIEMIGITVKLLLRVQGAKENYEYIRYRIAMLFKKT